MAMSLFDPTTIQVYEDNAESYSSRIVGQSYLHALDRFCSKMPRNARVLDLGCGAGWAAEYMQKRGLDIYALDASPKLAAIASRKISRPAAVLRFDELVDVGQYDGVFACNVLTHVPKAGVPQLLNRIAQSLRENGVLYACFATGDGEMRDPIGRYYGLYTADELLGMFEQQPSLKFSSMRTQSVINEFGEPQILFGIFASKKSHVIN